MELNELAKRVMAFRKPSANELYAILNLSGEVGELHSKVAKRLRDVDPDKETEEEYKAFVQGCVKELGDILWCTIATIEDFGSTLEDTGITLIEKLEGRSQRGTLGGSGDDR